MFISRKKSLIIIAIIIAIVSLGVLSIQIMAKDSTDSIISEQKPTHISKQKPADKFETEQKPAETSKVSLAKAKVEEQVTDAVTEEKAPKDRSRGRISILNEELRAIIHANNLASLDEDQLSSIQFSLENINKRRIVRRGNVFIDQSTGQIVALINPGQMRDEFGKDLLTMIDIDFSISPANAVFNYDFDVHETIVDNQFAGLQAFRNFLAKHKGEIKNILVVGNTDSIGSVKYNWGLSLKRGESFCRLANVEADTVVVIPRGESSPGTDNFTEDGRAKNRRVEVIIKFKEI